MYGYKDVLGNGTLIGAELCIKLSVWVYSLEPSYVW